MRAALLAALLTLALPARADVAPTDEMPNCTVSFVQHAGQTCETCQGIVTDPGRCQRDEAIRGYSRACVGAGHLEVWCIDAPPALPPPPAAPPTAPPPRVERPCDCSAPGAHASSGGALALAFVTVLLAGRRRRR